MAKRILCVAILVLACCVGFSNAAATPPLADRIPGDAILYFGWAGTDALATQYDSSHLKKVVDASDCSKFFDDFIPQFIERVSHDNREVSAMLTQITHIAGPMWKHPTALYFGGMDWNAPQPTPRLAVLCDAGDPQAAVALQKQIQKTLSKLPRDQVPAQSVKIYDSLVVFAFGTDASIDADFAQSPADNLAKSAKFNAACQQVPQDIAYAEYVDVEAAVKVVDDVLARVNNDHYTETWQHIRDAVGIGAIHNGIVVAGFDGADWMTQGFVATGETNAGILAMIRGTPLSKEILAAVPKAADRVIAGKFDLDNFVGNARDLVAQIDASTGQQIDDALANINQSAGIDIRKDLLANLGDEWVFYSDREIAGTGILGSVLVNHLKNADGFDNAVTQLSLQLNKLVADAIHQPMVNVEFHQSVVNGTTLHYLAVPFVTPCWAVQDGNLYMGLYPQVVSGAAEHASKHAPSILENERYVALMKRLGDHPASEVEYSNLPATAPDNYSDLLMMSRMYLGYADIYGVHPPAILVPPLSKIMPELAPSGSVGWSDSLGLHTRSICPFPGSELMSKADRAKSESVTLELARR